jgi:hypothetical protein
MLMSFVTPEEDTVKCRNVVMSNKFINKKVSPYFNILSMDVWDEVCSRPCHCFLNLRLQELVEPAGSVENMYVFEGKDYSTQPSSADQKAFDELLSGECIIAAIISTNYVFL